LLAVNPAGSRAASAFSDGSLMVWDMESGRTIATLDPYPDDTIGWLAITSEGLQVISSLMDGRLKIWDLESGQVLYTFTGHTEGIGVVVVTPDGRRAISVSIQNICACDKWGDNHSWHGWFKDGTLKIWDLESGRELVSHS
jgi:WD40 repeat protein